MLEKVKGLLSLTGLMMVLISSLPHSTVAAPNTPQGIGVHEENFGSYTHKGYLDNTKWDIWNGNLTVLRQDAVEQMDPSIVSDGMGGFFVVWTDARQGNKDIYAQRLDANGNRLWQEDLQVNSDSGSAWQTEPDITVDSNGNLFVVWTDDRSGSWHVWVQKVHISGNKLWSNDMQVDVDVNASPRMPAIAVNASGDIFVTWQDSRHGYSDYDIYAQALDASGNQLWMTDLRVNSDTDVIEQWYPAIAIDVGGQAIVVWRTLYGDVYSDTGNIYAQRLESSGVKAWPSDIQVNTSDETTLPIHSDYLSIDRYPGGGVVVAWTDDKVVYAQRVTSTGNIVWSTEVKVSDGGGNLSRRSVSVDESGNIVIVWESWNPVYAQRLNGAGDKSWPADLQVNSQDIQNTGLFAPTVAVENNGNAVVVWVGRPYGQDNEDIYVQKVNINGDRMWDRSLRVNADEGAVNQASSSIVVDGNGNTIVVWADWRSGNWNVYAQRLGVNGNPLWDEDVRVNSSFGMVARGSPTSVDVDNDGEAIIAWEDERNGADDIYAQRLDANGNRLWNTDIKVNSDDGSAYQERPKVAMDNNGNTVFVWSDHRNDPGRSSNVEVYAQYLDAQGGKIWVSDVRVNADIGSVFRYSPGVAVGLNGEIFVVWRDLRNDPGDHSDADIYAQRLNTNGTRLWTTDLRINSDGPGNIQHGPSIVADDYGHAVIVWEDRRSGRNIYAQKIDINGSKLWVGDILVNLETSTIQGFPSIDIDDSDYAIVVWENGYNGSDILAQRIDSNGNRQWIDDQLVNSDIGYARQYRAHISTDSNGNSVIVWQDKRNGNYDPYVQHLSADGVKLWNDDVQVVSPDYFYYPTGVAQSKTVDATDSYIVEATLTSQYILQGGNVQFYLTNDGGAHWSPVTPGVTHVFTTTGSDLRWRVEMTADPLWPRSPVIDSLRIEYTTGSASGDDYETDDTCADARPIQVNGGAQHHNFHQQGDADWVWFDAVAGVTYIVQTANTEANADTTLEIHDTCSSGPPAFSDDNAFGTDARITFDATETGKLYVKVTNTTDTATTETGYDLMVRTFTQAPVAVIVGGHDDHYKLQSNIDYITDMAYRTLLNAGVPKANVRYFSPDPERDVDGNGSNDDIYATATVTNVRDAVQNWARDQGVGIGVPFYVVLADHGHYDQFLAAGRDGKIWAADLNLWLSNLEATSGADNINVIFEACKSGSFIDVTSNGPDEISGHNRVVIAATSSSLNAYPSAQGGHFSDAFWTAIGENQDLKTAFERGKRAVQQTGLLQTPWLDDNGDAIADAQDGALAQTRGLGGAFAGTSPVIDWVTVGEIQNGQAAIQSQVRDDFNVTQVRVDVYPPDFVEPPPSPDETTPEITVPTATLTLDSGDVFSTTYTGFTQTGQYRLVVYAQDDERNQALPQAVNICVNCTHIYLPLVLRGE